MSSITNKKWIAKTGFLLLASLICAVQWSTHVPKATAAMPGANGKITYASNGDGNAEIYTIDADGSNLTRLTNNPAAENYPTYSPDG